jgi:hypothetical protein
MTVTGSIEVVPSSIVLSFPRALYPANTNGQRCLVARFVCTCGCGGTSDIR